MYTHQRIQKMTKEERATIMDELAQDHYGRKNWKTLFAQDFCISQRTVWQWFTVSSVPPWALVGIMLLAVKRP